MSSIKKNLLYNSAYQLLTLFIPLITTPYVSRVLGASGVGEISFVSSVTTYFALFCMLGVSNYGNRSIAAVRNDNTKLSYEFVDIYTVQLLFSAIVIIIYFVFVVFIADNKTLFTIYSLLLISYAIDITWFYFGMELFKVTVLRNTIIRLLSFLSVFVFVRSQEDVNLYGFIIAFSTFLSQVLLWIQVKKYVDFQRLSWKRAIKHIKGMCILFIPVIAISLYKTMDKVMLGTMISKTELGYYESCEKITHIPVALVNALGSVMLPRLSNLVANNKKEEGDKYFDKSLYFALFIACSMSFGIMGVANNFVPLFYGNGFDKCIIVFQFLMPNIIFWAFANVVRTQYLIPYKMDSIYIYSVFTGAGVNLIFNLILIPNLGASGAAIGTFLAEASVCLVQTFAIRKERNMKKNFIDAFVLILISIIMYDCISYIPFGGGYVSSILVQVTAGIIIFTGLNLIYIRLRFKEGITTLLNIRKRR